VLHFRENYKLLSIKRCVGISNWTIVKKRRLDVHYLNQADRSHSPGIGPVYSAPPYRRQIHGIGNFSGSPFRWVRPILWSVVKSVGRETLRTGGNIMTDNSEHRSPEVSAGDIVS